jgi:RNA recognition motif-containing protein
MNIFVGNIAFTASEDDLRELFEQHGTVDKVHLITDRYTGRSRGFGFVEMPNADEGNAAIAALNGASLHNRPLTINEARPREPRRDSGRQEY